MNIEVKKDTCIGCGACTVIASNVFEIGDDGLAQMVEEIENIEEEKENIIDAQESCPTGAIEVTEKVDE